MSYPWAFLLTMIDEQQKKFIDAYLQTYSIEQSAIKAGYDKREAMTIGVDLLANKEIQEALKAREKDFDSIAQSSKLTPERLLNTMMFQYEKANRFGKTKEAVEILEKIAKWSGVNPEAMQINPVIIEINNLDESKI